MDIKGRVLAQAQALFMKYGIRSVTMDDFARALGISKKTIYQYFNNKADIVFEVVKAHIEEEEEQQEHIISQATNAIQELTLLVPYIIQSFEETPSHLIHEVQKYYPLAWQLFEKHKSGFILEKVRENLIRGIKEGFYRSRINVELVARMRIAQIDASLSQDLFPSDQFDSVEVQIQMFNLYMYGIVSDKGRKLLNTYLVHGERYREVRRERREVRWERREERREMGDI